MTAFRTLDDAGSLAGKRVLLRVDLNVPMEADRVTDATRIERVVPTIREIADKGGRVILLAHFGRPKGKREPKDSLRALVPTVSDELGRDVAFAEDCIGEAARTAVAAMRDGDVLLLENTRYHAGEETNDPDFARALAENGDLYVNEAFSAAHRAHASTEGLAHHMPAFAGRLMQAELDALTKGLESPKRPVIALVGGAKVSTKIDLLENLVAKVDILVIGGGMANTFLHAQGKTVGKSLCEKDLAETAKRILAVAETQGCTVILPVDARIAKEFRANAEDETVSIESVPDDAMILDVGAASIATIDNAIDGCKTLVWNGPLGAFELEPFDTGTTAVAQHAAARTKAEQIVSVAGGGDTVAALNRAGVGEGFSYVSTAGGAFLEWLEGKTLPGVAALQMHAS